MRLPSPESSRVPRACARYQPGPRSRGRLSALAWKAPRAGAPPGDGRQAVVDQRLDEVRMSAVLRYPRHVVEELVARIGAEIGALLLRDRKVGDGALVIREPVIDEADGAGGVAAVAAALLM